MISFLPFQQRTAGFIKSSEGCEEQAIIVKSLLQTRKNKVSEKKAITPQTLLLAFLSWPWPYTTVPTKE